jgi:NitT/TauT family transport system ATP-binding protein
MTACLEIVGLNATLANGVRVLRDVSLTVEPGEVRALVGESGAGKSMIGKAERRIKAAELLDLVHLAEAADRRPHELSGGMRQRVALARSLAQDRQLLLMDEPFAALDAITRDLLHDELERIWKETGRTIVFVTHNVREAVRLGQRVLLLSSRPGRVVQEWEVTEEHRTDAGLAGQLTGVITARLREEIRRHAK